MLREILRETPAYKQLLKEGREEEKQARIRSLKQKLLNVVQVRFFRLRVMTKRQISLIKQPETLEDLLARLALASTEEQARDALITWKEPGSPDEDEI